MSQPETKGMLVWFWEALEGFLTIRLTEKSLETAGAGDEALGGAVTTRADLPTLYSQEAEESRQRDAAVAFMRSQKGTPYRFGVEVRPGGESLAGEWDCSELTEAAARLSFWAPTLPDGAQAQYDFCQAVRKGKAGDLHFLWSDTRGCIGHVMMDTGEGTVVHAVKGRGVVEDPLGMWTVHPRYRGCRRAPCFARPKEDRA